MEVGPPPGPLSFHLRLVEGQKPSVLGVVANASDPAGSPQKQPRAEAQRHSIREREGCGGIVDGVLDGVLGAIAQGDAEGRGGHRMTFGEWRPERRSSGGGPERGEAPTRGEGGRPRPGRGRTLTAGGQPAVAENATKERVAESRNGVPMRVCCIMATSFRLRTRVVTIPNTMAGVKRFPSCGMLPGVSGTPHGPCPARRPRRRRLLGYRDALIRKAKRCT